MEPNSTNAEPAERWSVWRIDDNGNVFLVREGISEQKARQLAAEFEARGHKQMYWVVNEQVN